MEESSTYQLPGVELVDLLRGYYPKGKVQLTKVGTDVGSLPDGVYFIPEDEALTGEPKYLEINEQKRRV
ncbi:hypothetical protein HW555_001333 [Spodoptera exigua]|uniref:Uncharacterized protein n=1 Tax=Spodoptera exigua TaxID=7107 RepID=A0A835GQ90_SPOEX|nr:hypothetical protein HW555_001333 [Spodoptera exigua]